MKGGARDRVLPRSRQARPALVGPSLARADSLPDVIGIVGSRGPDPSRGRDTGWTDSRLVSRLVRRAYQINPRISIVSGGAPSGVDHDVAMVCKLLRFCDAKHIDEDPTSVDCPEPHFYEFKALWHGKSGREPTNRLAGFDRNDKLVRHVGLVLALFGPGEMTPGTSDTVRRCRQYNVPVLIYHEGVWR